MSKKILIVDDEEALVDIMAARLEKSGFDVLVAYDGLHGLELARKEKPDLIVLDIMLPKMDGYNVCRMLKFDNLYKHIPIILATAKGQKTDFETGKSVSADAYIVKPFEWEDLLEEIDKLLNKKLDGECHEKKS